MGGLVPGWGVDTRRVSPQRHPQIHDIFMGGGGSQTQYVCRFR